MTCKSIIDEINDTVTKIELWAIHGSELDYPDLYLLTYIGKDCIHTTFTGFPKRDRTADIYYLKTLKFNEKMFGHIFEDHLKDIKSKGYLKEVVYEL